MIPPCPGPYTRAHFVLHSLPLESLRFKHPNYLLSEFPSLKEY